MTKVDLSKEPLITDLRKSIDYLDTSFLNLLTERMRVVRKVMFIKQKKKLGLGQSEARKEDMKKLIEMSVQLKLESVFFKKILNHVFEDALESYQNDVQQPIIEVMEKVCQDFTIEDLRSTLLNIDKSICTVLAERFKVVKRIGLYKHSLNVPPLDEIRWQQVIDNKVKAANKLGISVSLITDIFNAIHEVALKIEDEIIN